MSAIHELRALPAIGSFSPGLVPSTLEVPISRCAMRIVSANQSYASKKPNFPKTSN